MCSILNLLMYLVSPLECQQIRALGMESGAIANQQISASSEWDLHHAASRARLKLPVVNVIENIN